MLEQTSFFEIFEELEDPRDNRHKCELKQAILVKLLYGTHHSGFFGTVFFLTGNANIFYRKNQETVPMAGIKSPLSAKKKFCIFHKRNHVQYPLFVQGNILSGIAAVLISPIL